MAGYGASTKRTIATALALPQSRSRATERLLRDEEPARRKDVLVDARHEGVAPVHGRGKEGHDGDETVVSLLALSVDGCDAVVPDIDYVLSPGRLLIAEEALRRDCDCGNAIAVAIVRFVGAQDNRGPGTVLRRSGRLCDAEGGHCEMMGRWTKLGC